MTDPVSLKRAARIAPLASGDRIRLAREMLALTQQDLVDRTDGALTAPALSQLERGKTRPSARTLVALVDATGCPPEFFLVHADDTMPPGFFRSLRAASARERKQHLAQARLLHDFVEALEEHVRLPEFDVPRYNLTSDGVADVERAANRLRDQWDLDRVPIPNVVRELERHGIVVARVHSFKREVDAFSVAFPARPIVVLGSEKGVTARSRFDAAHELGHLVLHDSTLAGHREAETQAHQFAAAFLMPATSITEELPERVDWQGLMRLKAKWRVSIQALLRRARDLDVLSQQRYVNAMKAMSVRGWRTQEPGDDALGPLESPKLLRRSIRRLQETGVVWQEVAEDAGLPVDRIGELLERTRDLRPRVEL